MMTKLLRREKKDFHDEEDKLMGFERKKEEARVEKRREFKSFGMI